MMTKAPSALLLVAVGVPFPARAAQTPVMCRGEVATIVGTIHRDELTGTSSRDVIAGLGGNDWIEDEGGDDLVCGGPDNDWIWGGLGADELYGGAEYDDLYGELGDDRLFGGPRSGELRNTLREDIMSGGLGDDLLQDGAATFSHAAGPVEVDLRARTATGEGTDRFVRVHRASGSEFADRLSGSGGADYLFGRGGDDVVDGFRGPDFVVGGGGSDVVSAGRGPDYLLGETPEEEVVGNDDYRGGPGRDRFTVGRTELATHVDLGRGRVYSEGVDVISGVEDLSGSWGAPNRLVGDEGDNDLRGGGPGDEIDGAGGDDVLTGWPYGTDDRLFGSSGDDVFVAQLCSAPAVMYDGGPGVDTLDSRGEECGSGVIRVDLERETFGSPGGTGAVVDVENVFGTYNHDVLIGNDEANVLGGVFDEDELFGGGGGDVLLGGPRRDRGDGGRGSDACRGIERKRSCETTR